MPAGLVEANRLPAELAIPTGGHPVYESWQAGDEPVTDGLDAPGMGVIYTSGTTGRPKGILRSEIAPEKLAQIVPTMFVRLLRLPEQIRASYDVSSLRLVVHAATPCAVPVKRAIIDWFGPIVSEYYGGSETGPVVWCDTEQWLAHPGAVGAAADGAQVRIVDADGKEVPAGKVGIVYVKPADYWPVTRSIDTGGPCGSRISPGGWPHGPDEESNFMVPTARTEFGELSGRGQVQRWNLPSAG